MDRKDGLSIARREQRGMSGIIVVFVLKKKGRRKWGEMVLVMMMMMMNDEWYGVMMDIQ